MTEDETRPTIVSYWQRYPLAYFLCAAGIVITLSSLGGLSRGESDHPNYAAGLGFLLMLVSQVGLLRSERVYGSTAANRILLALFSIGGIGAVAGHFGEAAYLAFAAVAAVAIYIVWRQIVVTADPSATSSGNQWVQDKTTQFLVIIGVGLIASNMMLREFARDSALGPVLSLLGAMILLASGVRSLRLNGIKRPWLTLLKIFGVSLALMLAGLAAVFGIYVADRHGLHLHPALRTALVVACVFIPAAVSFWYSLRVIARARDELRP